MLDDLGDCVDGVVIVDVIGGERAGGGRVAVVDLHLKAGFDAGKGNLSVREIFIHA